MSKAIKWQIPFASLSGTLYRIDIYAEGYSGDPIQLTAGETPFVTDEDSSEDFFAPIRTQTGSIQVCTRKPDGTMLTLDEILPANNIDHPVRLINLSNSNAIEWQGFLSCEAYSQNYTAIPENLTLSVISVLEAMDSVQLDQTHSTGLTTIKSAIKTALEEIRLQSGMSLYDYVNYSGSSYRIFNKYIDQTVFFERKEYNNENSTTYIVSGISVKDVLSRLATYMGWSVREQGRTLYFERIGGDIYTFTDTYAQFGGSNPSVQQVALTESAIANFDWRGTDHKRDIRQGAKSVAVAAKLEKYNLKIEIPECPVGNLVESYYSLNNIPQYLYELGNSDAQAYSHCTFAYYAARCFTSFLNWEAYWQSNFSGVFSHMAAGENSTAKDYRIGTYQFTFYAGAFLAKYCWENSSSVVAHSTQNALHCVFFPRSINASWDTDLSNFDTTKVGSIFSINSITEYRCNSGYLCIKATADTIFMLPETPPLQHKTDLNSEWIVVFELRFGNKWWNGTSWQSAQCTFNATMTKSGFKPNWDETMPIEETDGLLVPITGPMSGLVTFKIWPIASSPSGYEMESKATLEMIFSQLNVDHILPDNDLLTDRGENHYFRLLGTNFRDEISIGTELASSLNNQPSPSLIMEDLAGTTPMTELEYTISGGTESRRPEVDLLNRLASYYGASRQTLDLITKHPVVNNAPAILPLLKLNGIGDGKVYLPLSESRDWREETCTIKCFETPT